MSRNRSFRQLLESTRLDGSLRVYDSLAQAVLAPPAQVDPQDGSDTPVTYRVETVAFACGHCWHVWTRTYEVRGSLHRHGGGSNGSGGSHPAERYFRNGAEAPSPYVPSGAPACPRCGRHWLGRLAAQQPKRAQAAIPAL